MKCQSLFSWKPFKHCKVSSARTSNQPYFLLTNAFVLQVQSVLLAFKTVRTQYEIAAYNLAMFHLFRLTRSLCEFGEELSEGSCWDHQKDRYIPTLISFLSVCCKNPKYSLTLGLIMQSFRRFHLKKFFKGLTVHFIFFFFLVQKGLK